MFLQSKTRLRRVAERWTGLLVALHLGVVFLYAHQAPSPPSVGIAASSSNSKRASKLVTRLAEELQQASQYRAIELSADSAEATAKQVSDQKLAYYVFVAIGEEHAKGIRSIANKVPFGKSDKSSSDTKTIKATIIIGKNGDSSQPQNFDMDAGGANEDGVIANLARQAKTHLDLKVSGDSIAATGTSAPVSAARPRLVVQTAHATQVIDFVYSSDGEIAATLAADGALKLWAARAGTEFRTFAGYDLAGIAMSPDGKTIAAVDKYENVRLIDTFTARIVRTIAADEIKSASQNSSAFTLKPIPINFSADGRLIAFAADSEIVVIDAIGARRIGTINQSADLFALSPSGEFVAVVPNSENVNGGGPKKSSPLWSRRLSTVELYRTSDVHQFQKFESYVGTLSALAFDPYGKRLIVGSRNGSIRILDAQTGVQSTKDATLLNQCDKPYEDKRKLDEKTKLIRAPFTSIVPGLGKLGDLENVDVAGLVSKGCESIDSARRFSNGGPLSFLLQPAPAAGIRSLAMSQDGQLLAYGRNDNLIVVRNLQTATDKSLAQSEVAKTPLVGKELAPVFFSLLRSPVKISSNGNGQYVSAIRAFKTVNRWDAVTGTQVSSLAVSKRDLSPFPFPMPLLAAPAFSKDGTFLTTSSITNGVRLWDLRSGTAETVSEAPALSTHLPISGDGKLVFSIKLKAASAEGKAATQELTIKETGSEKEVLKLPDEFEGFAFPAFSSTARYVVIQDLRSARVYDVKSGAKLFSVANGEGFDFSADDQLFAYSDGKALNVLRTSDWKTSVLTAKLVKSEDTGMRLSVLHFAPDLSRVALVDDGKIKLWDLQTGKLTSTDIPKGDVRGGFVEIVFAPTKKRISFAANRSLYHWDYDVDKVTKSNIAAEFYGNLAYSPDGKVLALGGSENRVRLFDLDREVEVGSLVAPSQSDWLMITPEGRLDASRLEEITEVHWIVKDEPIKAQPLELFTRDFYEPRLLPRLLKYEPMPEIPDLSARNRSLPKVEITDITPLSSDNHVTVKVSVQNTTSDVQNDASGHPLQSGGQSARLFRDGRLVASAPDGDGDIKFDASGKAVFEFTVAMPHAQEKRSVEISAYAFNSERAKSLTTHRSFDMQPVSGSAIKGKAYVITIGVNSNQNPNFNLLYAANDATAISAAVCTRLASTNTYQEIITLPLISDASRHKDLATKENIMAVLDVLAGRAKALPRQLITALPTAAKLAKATPDDLVLISFAGHGYAENDGQFFLIPSNLGAGQGTDLAQFKTREISSNEMSAWLQSIDAQDLIMIIDACQSAAAVDSQGFKPGPMGSRGLGQMAYDKGMEILAATQKSDAAIESSQIGHGLLTYALVEEGLNHNRADFHPIDKKIMLTEWLRFGVADVPELDQQLQNGTLQPARGVTVHRENANKPSAQIPALFDFRWNRRDSLLSSVQ